MPNIRIKDIPTTASATVNGDFFAVDSNASTRKLNAFAPTFGGDATAAGTIKAGVGFHVAGNGAPRPSGVDSYLAATSASQTPLVVSGFTGSASTVDLFKIQDWSTDRFIVTSAGNVSMGGSISIGGTTTSRGTIRFGNTTYPGFNGYISEASTNSQLYSAFARNLIGSTGSTYTIVNGENGNYAGFELGNAEIRWFAASGTFTTGQSITPVERMRLSAGGNLLLKSDGVDSTNGRIQLATHTSISGGIGFGTDTSIWRNFANQLTTSAGTLIGNGGGIGYFSITTTASAPLVLGANGVESLRIDGSTQNATFAKDILLGTNGPSVPSTLSGRAPRQGLVSDGTGLITVTSPTIGTGDFTASAWINVASYVASVFGFSGAGGVNSAVLDFPSNTVMRVYDGATTNAYTITVPTRPTNKWFNATWVRSAGVVTFYIDGVAQGSIAANFDIGSVNYIGSISAFNKTTGKLSGCYTYNRALSADEVRQLYENGVPATEDLGVAGSIAPSNTTLTTSAVAQNFAYDTFSSTTNSFSAVETGGQACEANFISGTTFLGKAPRGARFRVSFTATLNSGAIPSVRLSTQAVAGTSSAIVNVVNGSNSIILQLIEPFTAETGTGAGRVTFATGSNTNYSISNLVVTRLGTVLAPDAAQRGSYLTWYDTSGNNSHITLPASGVTWNVPASSVLNLIGQPTTLSSLINMYVTSLAGSDTTGGRITWHSSGTGNVETGFLQITQASGFGGTFKIGLNTTNSGIASQVFQISKNGSTLINAASQLASTEVGALQIADNSNANRKLFFGIDNTVAPQGVSYIQSAVTGTTTIPVVLQPNGGVVLIGTTTDSGAKLQVAGSGYFAGGISTKLATNNSGSNLFSILRADGTTSLLTATDANDGLTLKLGYTGLGNGSNWISLTGNGGGPGANITLNNGVVASFGGISYQVNGLTRWYVARSTAAETGSNAGSDFSIISYNDAGATIGTVFSITRSNSAIQCAGSLTAFGPINASSLNTPNGTTVGPFTTSIGADATLGALTVSMGGSPSATAANRFGYIGAGDAGAWRRFIIGSNNATGGGQVLIPSTDISSSTSSGALVVSGGVGIAGNTYIGGNLVAAAVVDPVITGTILEDIFTITDAAAFEVDPGNGSIQLITLGASRTPKATNFAAGESVTMMIDDGTAFTLTWTDATWGTGGVKWVGGSAPTLATTGYTVIQLWKVGTQVYGARVGDVV